ncbi:MAG: ATP-binding protein [Prolixibacteraceae bacterium]
MSILTKNTYQEYSDSFEIQVDPEILDFGPKDDEYAIYDGTTQLLQTPGSNKYSHSSKEVIELLLTDIQLYRFSTQNEFSSPVLFSFWKDIKLSGADHFLDQWESVLSMDPFVLMKTAEKSRVQPLSPDDPLFNFSYVLLSALLDVVNSFAERVISEVSMEENDSHPFLQLLRLCYKRFATYQQVAVQALSEVHQSGIVLPILLVSGEISAAEYAKGLISLKIKPKEVMSDLLAGVARIQSFLGVFMQKPHIERAVSEIIAEGEGNLIEFKSTLRWDIRAGKTNPAIERSCLKTISAFLNSSGGTLLIGVRDDGSIEGIETDKFANEDKFLLHLWTLIRICLGRDFSPFIRTRIEKMDEKTICVVNCSSSDRPVFLHQPGFDEEMYIRLGPSSNALNISEALIYVGNHFHS